MVDHNKEIVVIKEKKPIEFNNAIAIAGFAGAGLVGTIAINYIIEKLKMKEIAYFSSRLIPPFTIFIDGILKYPLRIYTNDEKTIVAIISEVPLQENSFFDIAHALLDWLESKKISEITVVAGVSVGNTNESGVFAAAEPEILDDLVKKGVKKLQRGLIGGLSASILNQCLHREMVGICLLAPTIEDMPDPNAAGKLVATLTNIYNLRINIDQLIKEAENVKKKRSEVSQAMNDMKEKDTSMRLYL